MTNTSIKKIFISRYTILFGIVLVILALCAIPITIKANNDRAKHAQIESVGITLIKSELDVYYYSHSAYPSTLAELLKDTRVTQSGGTATTMKVLPYFMNLRYAAGNDHKTYTMTYNPYAGGNKTVTGRYTPTN